MCDVDTVFTTFLISSVAASITTNIVWSLVLMRERKKQIRELGKKIGR